MAKKVENNKDILEGAEAMAENAQGWAEKNPKIILGIAAAIALAAAGYFGWRYYIDNLNKEAQAEMFQAVFYFEADSLDLALKGDGNNLGFVNIIEDYKFTDAANLANFYAGVAYLKQGKFEVARLYLEDFSSNDLLVQARAYSLLGDTYMEEEKFEEAASYYSKAAGYKPNKFFTPAYLMKAAIAYEKLNQNDKALEAYNKIIDEYWDSAEFRTAQKMKAKLSGNS